MITARRGLRAAAEAVLAAWNDAKARQARLPEAIAALRTVLDGKLTRPARDLAQPPKPREGTKQQQVLAMLRRPEGATVAQIAEATGWQASVRAYVEAQGLTLVAEYQDVASGKDDRRAGFPTALARCQQFGAVLVAARLDRITRRTHTLSGPLEEGYQLRAADMPGADDLMMRIYAAMAQQERELISERTKAALRAAKACRATLGGDRGYWPTVGPAPTQRPRLGA